MGGVSVVDSGILSHHIETVLGVVLGIVGTPVREASSQLSIGGAVVQLQQPGGGLGVAVLGVEHGTQGGDHTLAGGGGHRVSLWLTLEFYSQWGAVANPPGVQCSDRHSLCSRRLAVASELASLTTLADRLAPVAALRLGAMHKEGKGLVSETV